jgi:hypothetical protein
VTRDDIIRLRGECDQWAEDHLQCKGEYHPDFHTVSDERFAALVASERDIGWHKIVHDECEAAIKEEREACATVCDEMYLKHLAPDLIDVRRTAAACADTIRARGETK